MIPHKSWHLQGTEYWLSLCSEGRNPRSGRSVYAAVEGAEVAVCRDGELCQERSSQALTLSGCHKDWEIYGISMGILWVVNMSSVQNPRCWLMIRGFYWPTLWGFS